MTNPRDIEDAIYEQIAAELARDEIRPGLMAKAVAKAKGKRDRVEGIYIELRAEQMARHADRMALQRQREADRIAFEQERERDRAKLEARQRVPPLPQRKGVRDAPLYKFFLKNPYEGFVGTKYELIVREESLCFTNLSSGDNLLIDPKDGDCTLRLHNPLYSTDHIELLYSDGTVVLFRASFSAYRALKAWWKRKRPN